jgi:hypothetical protein
VRKWKYYGVGSCVTTIVGDSYSSPYESIMYPKSRTTTTIWSENTSTTPMCQSFGSFVETMGPCIVVSYVVATMSCKLSTTL